MLSMVKMSLKKEIGSHALNSHGNYIVDHGKSWKNHGIVFSNFCGNPAITVGCLPPDVWIKAINTTLADEEMATVNEL